MAGWSPDDIPDLSGKVAVVTGANSGIGLGAAGLLADHGADVVMACRDPGRAQAALEKLQARGPRGQVETMALDLADLASVRAFAEAYGARRERLDLLCNNAGVMALPRQLTADGFEMQIGVNHFGHFALTGLLLPALLASQGARVVTVSSVAHRMGRMHWDDLDLERRYERWRAYGQSKLANLLFAFELQRRLARAAHPAISLACHPGYANTNLQFVAPEMEGAGLRKAFFRTSNRLFAQSPEQGAWPTVYAATAPELAGGEYIGPSGLGEMRGPPKRVGCARAAQDEAAAARLWDLSVERTGTDYGGL